MYVNAGRVRASPSRCVAARVTQNKREQLQQEATAPEPSSQKKKTEKIYIGQGRYVDDNPAKYPDKDGLGVGGWAGGEEGAQCALTSVQEAE